MNFFLPSYTLWKREQTRFYRQKSRIAGVLGSPLLFWFLIGSGFGNSLRLPGMDGEGYLEFFFHGTVLLIVLFSEIFSSISTIEDRREGFLQSVLVSPASRASIVFGKIFGITTLAVLQGTLFLLLAGFVGIEFSVLSFLSAVITITFIGFSLASLGFFFAWKLDSSQGFHAIMNLVLVPLWLLSGAIFPMNSSSQWLSLIMHLNPLSYGLDWLRYVLYWNNDARTVDLLNCNLSIAVTLLFGSVMFYLSVRAVKKK